MKQDFDEFGRGYWRLDDLDKRGGSTSENEPSVIDNEKRIPATKEEANLLSSATFSGGHCPVLDIDIPARYVPSSTEGHGHLYINKALTWEQYEKLLDVLGEVGILESGYVGAAKRRKATFVRPEWIHKPINYSSPPSPLKVESNPDADAFLKIFPRCKCGKCG